MDIFIIKPVNHDQLKALKDYFTNQNSKQFDSPGLKSRAGVQSACVYQPITPSLYLKKSAIGSYFYYWYALRSIKQNYLLKINSEIGHFDLIVTKIGYNNIILNNMS